MSIFKIQRWCELMILREGIIGFHNAKSEQIPIGAKKQFKHLCFSVSPRIVGIVMEFED